MSDKTVTAQPIQHGPSRIFIVRHGDRIDHENSKWRASDLRPHDSPLSERGHQSAHLLGRYLANHRNVRITSTTKASDIVVLASPLQRTVETGHGIIYGIIAASGARHLLSELQSTTSSGASANSRYAEAEAAVNKLISANDKFENTEVSDAKKEAKPATPPPPMTPLAQGGEFAGQEAAEAAAQLSVMALQAPATSASASHPLPFIPIYLEPGVIEGEYWQNRDIGHGVSMGNTKVSLVSAGTSTRHKDRDADDDQGVFRGAAFHKAHVSTLVQPSSIQCPRRVGISSATKDHKALPYVSGFGDVWFEWDKKAIRIVEHSDGVRLRCQNTIKNISESPALDGKIVIIIGHGETTLELAKGLMPHAKSKQPVYTSFTECVRMSNRELNAVAAAVTATSSAAPNVRGLGARVQLPNGNVVAERQTWRTADWGLACDSPHLREFHAV